MTERDDRQRKRAEQERQRRERASREARERIDRGRWFHLGMAARRGETRENGWVLELSIKTLNGARRLDTALVRNDRDRHFAEYKSGRTPDRDALQQLTKDRELLEKGWCGTWVRVEGVKFGRAVEKELARLQREFDDQFNVVYVTEAEARAAIQRGQELERQHQRELFSGDQLRQREERKKNLERIQEAERTRAAAAKAIAAKKEKEQREREQGRDAAAAAEKARQQQVREQQERQQRDRDDAAAEHGRTQQTREEAERAAAKERERLAREAYEHGRGRLPPDVADLLGRSYPVPGDEVHGGPGPHGGNTRAGREGRGRGREREERGRERR